MKINKKKENFNRLLKTFLLIAAVGSVLVSLGVVYAIQNNNSSKEIKSEPTTTDTVDTPSPVNYENATNDQIKAGNDIKEQSINDSGSDTTNSLSLSVVAYAKDSSSTSVVIDINPLVSTGECSLTITNGSIEKVYTSDIQAQAQYATCQGFVIKNEDLGSGIWNLTANVTSGEFKATKSTKVEVK